MEDVKFVVTDLDNTLLNHKKQISKQNHLAIKELKEKGIYFGLASGRDYHSVFQCCKEWNIDALTDIIIGCNGVQIYHHENDELTYLNKIPKEVALQIYETYKDTDGVYFVRNGDHRYQEKANEEAHKDALKYKEPEVYVDLKEYLQSHDVEKISVFCQPEQMNAMKELAQTFLPKLPVSMMASSSHLLEFMDKDTNKGTGLKMACQKLNIPIGSSMAFGDATNDYTLIEASGIGVCMKNGTDDVKAIADYITQYTNEEDGFYHFLKQYVL